MSKKSLFTCVFFAVSMIFYASLRAEKPLLTTPSTKCRNVVGGLVAPLKEGGNLPGNWTLKVIYPYVSDKPFIELRLVGSSKRLAVTIVNLNYSSPLFKSTKYFTLGYRSTGSPAAPGTEKIIEYIAEIVGRNESDELADGLTKECSRPMGPDTEMTVALPQKPDYLFGKYDKEIKNMFLTYFALPRHNLWSYTYVSRYLVINPFPLLVIAVLLFLYVKAFSRFHKNRS